MAKIKGKERILKEAEENQSYTRDSPYGFQMILLQKLYKLEEWQDYWKCWKEKTYNLG